MYRIVVYDGHTLSQTVVQRLNILYDHPINCRAIAIPTCSSASCRGRRRI